MVKEAGAAQGGVAEGFFFPMNATERASVDAAVAAAVERYGGLDISVVRPHKADCRHPNDVLRATLTRFTRMVHRMCMVAVPAPSLGVATESKNSLHPFQRNTHPKQPHYSPSPTATISLPFALSSPPSSIIAVCHRRRPEVNLLGGIRGVLPSYNSTDAAHRVEPDPGSSTADEGARPRRQVHHDWLHYGRHDKCKLECNVAVLTAR